jgi:hypothetical protein
MTSRAEELEKLLGPMKKLNIQNSKSYTTGTTGFSISSLLYGIAILLLVIFIILLVVHYTVKPIFTFSFGDKGIFGLSNTNDGQLVWTKAPGPVDISANVLRVIPSGITIQQDILVNNEPTIGLKRRVFFYRSRSAISVNSVNTDPFYKDYPDTNLLMYLAPGTNDLTVTAITTKGNNELYPESTPTILNVPVRRVFRLTVVLLDQMMEVYLNGKLVGTKTFRYPLLRTNGYFFSSPQIFSSAVRVMNFQYWNRALTAMEILKAPPGLADMKMFKLEGVCA